MRTEGLQIMLVAMLLTVGYQGEVQKSETKLGMAPFKANFLGGQKVLAAQLQKADSSSSLSVQYQTRNQNVFVECVVTGVSFRDSDRSTQKIGKIIIWMDGKRQQEATGAAFIVKNVPPGDHHLKIEVVSLDNKPYGMSKEFTVHIPGI